MVGTIRLATRLLITATLAARPAVGLAPVVAGRASGVVCLPDEPGR